MFRLASTLPARFGLGLLLIGGAANGQESAPAEATPAAARPILADAEPSTTTVFVRLRDDVFVTRIALLGQLRALATSRGSATAWRAITDQLERGSKTACQSATDTARAAGGTVRHRYWIVPGFVVDGSPTTIARLRAHPDVADIEPVQPCSLHMNWATDGNNHGVDAIQQQYSLFGAGATMALLDGGIDASFGTTGTPHPALRDSRGATRLRAAIGVATASDAEDMTGHGTAVASVALGRNWTTGSDDGFAPEAGLVSYKLTNGASRIFDTAIATAAYQRVLTDRATYGTSVMNSSFGGPSQSDPHSFVQIAADTCAYFGDILHVTSAGNSGGAVFPTADSQSNCNGLSVGATDVVLPNLGSHSVLPTSSHGPLFGDPQRDFPDLVAVGWVSAAQADKPDLARWQGTSFSAPMVAGTGLLLRGAIPWLTSLDTRALILNNTESILDDNPGKSRQFYGEGFLRSDESTTALLHDQLVQGVFLSGQNGGDIDHLIAATKNELYTATVCWPRVQIDTNTPWDDIDLIVLDPNGQRIAISDSRRNLHERVVFRPRTTGNHTVRVRLHTRNAPSLDLPFSLAFGKNPIAGRPLGEVASYGTGCTGSAADPAFGILLPSDGILRGKKATRVPFTFRSCRVQQAFPHADVEQSTGGGAQLVSALALRRDEAQGDAPGFTVVASMWLGYTERRANGLSAEFEANWNTDPVLVTDKRTIRFPPVLGIPQSAQFDYVIPFDRPFTLLTAPDRNLLWETKVYSNTRPRAIRFDATDRPDLLRLFGGSPDAPFGTPNDAPLIVSLRKPGSTKIAPELQAGTLPQLGEPWTSVMRYAAAQQAAVWFLGTSNTTWGSTPLPIDLTSFGAPGCLLQAEPLLATPVWVDASGAVEVSVDIPFDSSFSAAELFGQFATGDPTVNSLGMVTTNGLRARIGG